MAELWGLPELRHWWLPNDEGYPPIVRSIRAFIEDRTQPHPQPQSEDVRNMKAIFSKMSIQPDPETHVDLAGLDVNSSDISKHDQSTANQVFVNDDILPFDHNAQSDNIMSDVQR